MKNNILVINESVNPYYNLALEEYLLTHYDTGTIMMLWQNEPTIVVGRHQNTLEEINQKYVEEHGIHVVRRSTGGGSVYHDLGNLNYSFIADRTESNSEGMREFAGYVISALKELGVDAEFSGRNDMIVQGKKVSGTAQRIYQNRILHHGCLLYNTDLSSVAAALQVRPEKFRSKSVKSVRSRVGNITDFMEKKISLERFKEMLVQQVLLGAGYERLELGAEAEQEVLSLQKDKYESWEWNYGNTIPYSVHNRGKYDGGFVEIYLDIVHGRIEKCKFFGDYMALRPSWTIEEALIGCRYERNAVQKILCSYRISDFFGSISEKEVLQVMFCAEE